MEDNLYLRTFQYQESDNLPSPPSLELCRFNLCMRTSHTSHRFGRELLCQHPFSRTPSSSSWWSVERQGNFLSNSWHEWIWKITPSEARHQVRSRSKFQGLRYIASIHLEGELKYENRQSIGWLPNGSPPRNKEHLHWIKTSRKHGTQWLYYDKLKGVQCFPIRQHGTPTTCEILTLHTS
jgi:hypothetical protein